MIARAWFQLSKLFLLLDVPLFLIGYICHSYPRTRFVTVVALVVCLVCDFVCAPVLSWVGKQPRKLDAIDVKYLRKQVIIDHLLWGICQLSFVVCLTNPALPTFTRFVALGLCARQVILFGHRVFRCHFKSEDYKKSSINLLLFAFSKAR